ncbi:DUF2971 domain-containing protein [Fluviicola sp. SGL-29]|nr:DUF2971 domain-containing protein [Fluviicola sp. SGL-29]
MDGMPKILYKYRDWKDGYHQRLLKEKELFLASAGQFNDPFDISLPYRFPQKDLTPENVFLKLYQTAKEMHPEYSDEQLHQMSYERQQSGVFENGQYWKENYPYFKAKMHAIIGVASFTTKKNNLLMWSHYADSHKGFCLGLDSELMLHTVAGMLSKVVYMNKFPEIPLFGDSFTNMIQILTSKSQHWKYEEEYRLTKVNGAKSTIILPDEAYKEIILGLNMTEEHREEIIQLVKPKFPNMKIYQSQMNEDEFKLDIIPIL